MKNPRSLSSIICKTGVFESKTLYVVVKGHFEGSNLPPFNVHIHLITLQPTFYKLLQQHQKVLLSLQFRGRAMILTLHQWWQLTAAVKASALARLTNCIIDDCWPLGSAQLCCYSILIPIFARRNPKQNFVGLWSKK